MAAGQVVLAEQRPTKTGVDWILQMVWVIGGIVASVVFFERDFQAAGILVLVVGFLQAAWIEYWARSVGQTKWVVLAVIMGLLALWGIHSRDER